MLSIKHLGILCLSWGAKDKLERSNCCQTTGLRLLLVPFLPRLRITFTMSNKPTPKAEEKPEQWAGSAASKFDKFASHPTHLMDPWLMKCKQQSIQRVL